MDRTNLAVCFSPVLFHIKIKKKHAKKIFSNHAPPFDLTLKPKPSLNKKRDLTEHSDASDNCKISVDGETSTHQAKPLGNDLTVLSNHKQKINEVKRKCSVTLNKAASSIANLSASFTDSTYHSFNVLSDTNIEALNKIAQTCVCDMIKYSMDLFTVIIRSLFPSNKHFIYFTKMMTIKVPVESFERLKLSLLFESEPHDLDYYYDAEEEKLKTEDFFKCWSNIKSANWTFIGAYLADVSIFYCKNEMLVKLNPEETVEIIRNQCHEKLRLWKCCAIVKNQNATLESIQQRISNER
jgi:hypothetical protein